jgi:hypothetical protein
MQQTPSLGSLEFAHAEKRLFEVMTEITKVTDVIRPVEVVHLTSKYTEQLCLTLFEYLD